MVIGVNSTLVYVDFLNY